MKKKFDNVILGLLIGLLAPLAALYIYYLFTYRYQTSFSGFLQYFNSFHIVVASISLACYASNLPLFFLFVWRERYQSARGVLTATIIYTCWVVYEKFFV
ncbi:MAG TPA: hypothetical protein VFU15_05000 [Bacteroidia bacterium]|nr:hypothetical protein [Bacteroidia bacterium]